MLSQG
jgi:hypothetical protein